MIFKVTSLTLRCLYVGYIKEVRKDNSETYRHESNLGNVDDTAKISPLTLYIPILCSLFYNEVCTTTAAVYLDLTFKMCLKVTK